MQKAFIILVLLVCNSTNKDCEYENISNLPNIKIELESALGLRVLWLLSSPLSLEGFTEGTLSTCPRFSSRFSAVRFTDSHRFTPCFARLQLCVLRVLLKHSRRGSGSTTRWCQCHKQNCLGMWRDTSFNLSMTWFLLYLPKVGANWKPNVLLHFKALPRLWPSTSTCKGNDSRQRCFKRL